MFLEIGLLLISLWILGFVVFHVTGFFIHILLVAAIIVTLIRIIKGK
ncbi:MAG: lmo0937 family membrane protein [bacterium]